MYCATWPGLNFCIIRLRYSSYVYLLLDVNSSLPNFQLEFTNNPWLLTRVFSRQAIHIEYMGINEIFAGVEKAVRYETSTILDTVRGKSKLVTWFVSNCDAKSGRMEYVQELSKHIGVDIYGKCGTSSCDKGKDCFGDVIEPNYFFYLSFENSFCDDYVTEKLMNPLR